MVQPCHIGFIPRSESVTALLLGFTKINHQILFAKAKACRIISAFQKEGREGKTLHCAEKWEAVKRTTLVRRREQEQTEGGVSLLPELSPPGHPALEVEGSESNCCCSRRDWQEISRNRSSKAAGSSFAGTDTKRTTPELPAGSYP